MILILAILIALLLPAINAAVRTAKNAAVGGEINQLAQALAAFKNQYGDYPPSRIFLSEDGNLLPAESTLSLPAGDISTAQLGQRSIAAMRKFFPRVTFNLGNLTGTTGKWYDFNGDGLSVAVNGVDAAVHAPGSRMPGVLPGRHRAEHRFGLRHDGIRQGPHESVHEQSLWAMPGYSGNRQTPFFQFVANRLALDPNNPTAPGIPGYLDSLGNESISGTANANTGLTDFYVDTSSGILNFYAYFSSYGNNGYDPNDVNFATEVQQSGGTGPGLQIPRRLPVTQAKSGTRIAPAILRTNPYTSTLTLTTLPTTLFEPAVVPDHLVGDRRQLWRGRAVLTRPWPRRFPYDASWSLSQNSLGGTLDALVEQDNVTNFHNGKLE